MARRFIVDGAKKDTGVAQQLVIEADDASQAEQIASIRGVFVSAVRQHDAPILTSVPPSAGPATPLQRQPPAIRSIAIIAGGVIVGVIGLILIVGFWTGMIGTGGKSSSHASIPGLDSLDYKDREFIDALEIGELDDVKRALQREPNFNAVDPNTGDTPLVLVIQQMDRGEGRDLAFWRELATAILKAGADVNGGKALASANKPWTMTFLLDHGANVDGFGLPASDFDYDKAVFLLAHGANPNAQDGDGQTPLHRAAAAGANSVVALLLQSKADVNKRDNKGYTPLKRARLSLQKEAADLLQRNGGVE